MLKYFPLLFCLFFIISPEMLSQDLVTDRPDQTESTVALPKGYFQIESGSIIEFQDNINSLTISSTLFRYGVVKNLELRLVSSLNFRKTKDEENGLFGIGDMEAGFKYSFLSGRTGLAYLAHMIIPSGTQEFGSEDLGVVHLVAFSQGITEDISVGTNIGHTFTDEIHSLTYTLALGFAITKDIGFFSEIYGDWIIEFEDWNLNYDNGLTYLLKPNLQLDFSFGTGITERYNFYSAGFSWRFPD